MMNTGLAFQWKSGSKNDNAIKLFKENNIKYRYNKYFELEADLYGIGYFQKICYVTLSNGEFGIIAK